MLFLSLILPISLSVPISHAACEFARALFANHTRLSSLAPFLLNPPSSFRCRNSLLEVLLSTCLRTLPTPSQAVAACLSSCNSRESACCWAGGRIKRISTNQTNNSLSLSLSRHHPKQASWLKHHQNDNPFHFQSVSLTLHAGTVKMGVPLPSFHDNQPSTPPNRPTHAFAACVVGGLQLLIKGRRQVPPAAGR